MPLRAMDSNMRATRFLCAITAANSIMAMPLNPKSCVQPGIEHAKVFIVAIDDIEDSMNVARHIRLNYPALKFTGTCP